jgi:signal transduction histidine kinase
MNSIADNRLHPLLLNFTSPQLEKEYGDWSFPRYRKVFYQALVLSSISVSSFFVADCFILGRIAWPLLMIRVAFTVVNVLLGLSFRLLKVRDRRQLDTFGTLFVILTQGNSFLIVFSYPELGEQYLLVMTQLSFLATITFTFLNFKYLMPSIAFVLMCFLIKLFFYDDLETPQMVFQSILMVSFTGIGLQSGYLIEKSSRIEFVIRAGLERRQQELLSKNKELEQFAYIASHDLQEPLRSITSFSQLLNDEYREKVGENGAQYLDFLLEASKRMRNLIKGLLDYSRLGRESKLATIDTEEVMKAILVDLSTAIAESKAKITYEQLPVLQVHETEFRQLLQNLLSNAIKFRRPGVAPEVHVSAKNKGAAWEFSVKDNGIGIAKEHHEKIFLIFQRLHNRSQYEGTGIGLANCRKIVEMHGGTIHLESEKNQGSNFYFTIPIR